MTKHLSDDPDFLAHWMSYLPDERPLRLLHVPGTHDSATFNVGSRWMPSCVEVASRCQVRDFQGQLTMGVRFLDLRARPDGMLTHGPVSCHLHLNSALDSCAAFLQQWPTEALIVRLKKEGVRPFQPKRRLHDVIKKSLETHPWMFYLSKEIPLLEKLRGKIWLIQQWEKQEPSVDMHEDLETEETTPISTRQGLGIPWPAAKVGVTHTLTWADVNMASPRSLNSMRLHDAFAQKSRKQKWLAVSGTLFPTQEPSVPTDARVPSGGPRDPRLRIVFTSATGLSSCKNCCLMPADFARFVNQRMGHSLSEKISGRCHDKFAKCGVYAMDFPSALLCKLIVLRNFDQEDGIGIGYEDNPMRAWSEAPTSIPGCFFNIWPCFPCSRQNFHGKDQ